MWRRLRRLFPRGVSLIMMGLGGWVVVANLVERAYPAQTIAWVVGAGLAGGAGGLVYLLSFDGPERFRSRPVRMAGWVGMVLLAGLPTSPTPVLLVLVAATIPTLLGDPEDNRATPST